MIIYHYGKMLLILAASLICWISSAWAAVSSTGLIALPPCGADPSVNSRMLQATIDAAPSGSTLVLPPGACIVAKCDIAQGHICYGLTGFRHNSAIHIGKKSDLTLVGAEDGTSVLKLDPNPSGAPGHHAYCGDTHVLSMHLSTFITLRDFTVDGSDGELPEDTTQCPSDSQGNPRAISEHMHDVRVVNAADVTLDRMKLIKAHGDGLNLIAERSQTTLPFTERVTVTNIDFLANDRAGVVFQRNVGFVTIRGNYFSNSGEDQDLDMEPTGGLDDRGPYEVDIDFNLFERLQPKIAVTLGAGGGVQPSRGIRFTSNTIRGVESKTPQPGGCIGVYTADQTTIANNTVVGAPDCTTVAAQKVTNLRIENNLLESYVNLSDRGGHFDPRGVIDIRERVVNRGDTSGCGASPKPPCPYFIHYPDGVTITGNKLIQHVQYAPGISVRNGDRLLLADNALIATQEIAPSGVVIPSTRATGVDLPFGVRDLPSYGYYENEKREFRKWAVTGNTLENFADGLHLAPVKATVLLSAAALSGNAFNTQLPTPRGIFLQGPATAQQDAFVTSLIVNKNRFGCGFSSWLPEVLPPHAYVRPSSQRHTGNVGVTIPCQ